VRDCGHAVAHVHFDRNRQRETWGAIILDRLQLGRDHLRVMWMKKLSGPIPDVAAVPGPCSWARLSRIGRIPKRGVKDVGPQSGDRGEEGRSDRTRVDRGAPRYTSPTIDHVGLDEWVGRGKTTSSTSRKGVPGGRPIRAGFNGHALAGTPSK